MWLFTTEGFYSVVQNEDDPTNLTVRTRTRQDAQNMYDWLAAKHMVVGDIHETPFRDYGWRMFVPREWFNIWLTSQVNLMDYGNFKEAVHERGDHERANVYLDVWFLLRRLLQPRVLI